MQEAVGVSVLSCHSSWRGTYNLGGGEWLSRGLVRALGLAVIVLMAKERAECCSLREDPTG